MSSLKWFAGHALVVISLLAFTAFPRCRRTTSWALASRNWRATVYSVVSDGASGDDSVVSYYGTSISRPSINMFGISLVDSWTKLLYTIIPG